MNFLNIWNYVNNDYPFQIFIGGRGTGKTYSALSGAVNGKLPNDAKFILMRRTSNELNIMLDSVKGGEGANPFKPINNDYERNIGMREIVPNLAGIYNREENDEGKFLYMGAPIGYGVALSTISSIRGIDFSDCSDCIYDEFIPEKHVRKIKDEGSALLNAYETMNRNREMLGYPAMRLWLLANSNDIYNPIFTALEIVAIVERMIRKGIADKYIKERGLAIHLVKNDTDFVEAKGKTALYKLTAGSQFADMALHNDFAYNDFSLISSRPLQGYRPVCALNDAYIYKKKGGCEYYVTYSPAQCPVFDARTEHERRAFIIRYGSILLPNFVAGNITFESYELKERILNAIL